MSDGQTFYLVFLAFYLSERFHFGSYRSIAFARCLGGLGLWISRPPVTIAWGIGKTVFFGPLLPVAEGMTIVSGADEKAHFAKKVRSASGVRRSRQFLLRATRRLRLSGLAVAASCFCALPVSYQTAEDETVPLVIAAATYLFMFAVAIHYNALHRRLFPRDSAERVKTTLYNALIPWSAIRPHDSLWTLASRDWSALATLALTAKSDANALRRLQQLWRVAHFHARPPYSRATLAAILDESDIDFSDWLNPPSRNGDERYCPCCHLIYQNWALHCADCRGQQLQPSCP